MESPRARGRRTTVVVVAGAVLFVTATTAAAVVLAVRTGPPGPSSVTASPAASAPAVASMVDGVDYWPGTNVDPGVYRQAAATPGCEWTVVDAITSEEVERGLPGAAGPVTVNLAEGTRFRSTGCGRWVPAD